MAPPSEGIRLKGCTCGLRRARAGADALKRERKDAAIRHRMTKRERRIIVDPASVAAGWAYRLTDRCWWSAFDLAYTERVDQEKTKELRARKTSEGVPNNELRKYSVKRRVWTQGVPPFYAFGEGDLIHSADGQSYIQILDARNAIELQGSLGRLTCTLQEFVDLLRTGRLPDLEQVVEIAEAA